MEIPPPRRCLLEESFDIGGFCTSTTKAKKISSLEVKCDRLSLCLLRAIFAAISDRETTGVCDECIEAEDVLWKRILDAPPTHPATHAYIMARGHTI